MMFQQRTFPETLTFWKAFTSLKERYNPGSQKKSPKLVTIIIGSHYCQKRRRITGECSRKFKIRHSLTKTSLFREAVTKVSSFKIATQFLGNLEEDATRHNEIINIVRHISIQHQSALQRSPNFR